MSSHADPVKQPGKLLLRRQIAIFKAANDPIKPMNKAKLRRAIPSTRYSATSTGIAPPKAGDTVYLDQGYTGEDGKPMCHAYMYDDVENISYSLELYETELEPSNSDQVD